MPATQSKEAPAAAADEAALQQRSRVKRVIYCSSALSVMQHFVTVQTEPRLVLELCGGNAATAAKLLGNTSGIVGLSSIFMNQIGGKLSDAIGRKPGFMVGPVLNILLGWLVFKNPKNKRLVLLCRILRMLCTTFSNTVMVDAALADVCTSREELQHAKSQVLLASGLSMLGTPFVEARLLQRGPKWVYLVLQGIAVFHSAFVSTCLPETLAKSGRKQFQLDLASINPLGFVRVFTEGSRALWQLTLMTTFQMFLEGKNMSDLSMNWVRDRLQWSVEGIRNFAVSYGVLCTLASRHMTPFLLKRMDARGFTSFTNCLNACAFALRGSKASTALWLMCLVPMLPGVNGACSIPLKAQATRLADMEGFGKGEYSAWSNNLRAIIGAIAPVIYGQAYAKLARAGANPGWTFALAGLFGAVLPQAMLLAIKDRDLGTAAK